MGAALIAVGAATIALENGNRGRAHDRVLAGEEADRDKEKELRDRFQALATLLSSESYATRSVACYAISALADDWANTKEPQQAHSEQQVCINVLINQLLDNETGSEVNGRGESIRSPGYFRHKLTVQSILRQRLEEAEEGSVIPRKWNQFDLNFDNCIFYNLDFSGLTFDGVTSFSGATFEGFPASFSQCEFRAYSRFEYSTLSSGADFSNAKFLSTSFQQCDFAGGTTTFEGATFAEKAPFNLVVGDGNVLFRETIFDGGLEFTGAHLAGAVEFDSCVFKKPADFSKSIFEAEVSFLLGVFEAGADFSGVSFAGRRADFAGARLLGPVSFNDAVFFGETNLSKAIFWGSADFDDAEFRKPVVFDDAKFLSAITFRGVRFRAQSRFFNAFFRREAHFSKAKFYEDSDFIHCIFVGDVWFNGSAFKKSAWFEGVQFRGGSTSFERATFSDYAEFCGAIFDQYVKFDLARFDSAASFEAVQFEEVDFESAIFGHSLILNGAAFWGSASLRYVELHGGLFFDRKTDFGESVDFSNLRYRPKSGRSSR